MKRPGSAAVYLLNEKGGRVEALQPPKVKDPGASEG